MKLITIGDSITHGQYTGPNDSFPNSLAKPYGEYLKEYLGCEYINYGHNGVAFSHTSTVNSSIAFENVVSTYEKGDIIIIAGGTNDFGTNVKLDDFSLAVSKVFSYIKNNNPNSIIIIMTPLHRNGESSNEIGLSLSQYSEILIQKAIEYGFIVVNGFDFFFDPNKEEDRNKYALDGLHLNNEGHKLLADFIISTGVLQ